MHYFAAGGTRQEAVVRKSAFNVPLAAPMIRLLAVHDLLHGVELGFGNKRFTDDLDTNDFFRGTLHFTAVCLSSVHRRIPASR